MVVNDQSLKVKKMKGADLRRVTAQIEKIRQALETSERGIQFFWKRPRKDETLPSRDGRGPESVAWPPE